MPEIVLDRVSLDYPLLGAGDKSLRALMANALRAAGQPTRTRRGGVVRALRNITLTAGPGDRIALIGPNGAGKSSLLRLLAGIFRPSAGAARLTGQIGTLFDIGYGMEGDLSGYDFVLDRGLFKGMDRATLLQALPEIRRFSGLGGFFEQPLRTYSDGMRVRLAFAVSTVITPDILLIDEIFGAGDQHFFEPACDRILDKIGRSGITVFSTHWLELADRFCNRAIWLEAGQLRYDGPVAEVFSAYRDQCPHA